MAIRSTGIRPIERNGLRGFGLTLTIDNQDQPDCGIGGNGPDAGAGREMDGESTSSGPVIHSNSQAFPSVGPADTADGAFLPASSAPIPHPAQNLPSEQAIASAGAEIAAASPFYSEGK